jgi:hypothetical protein
MTMPRTVEIVAGLLWETARAILVDDGTNQFWLPKSQIEYTDPDKYDVIIVTMPEWLAKEKDLI